MDTLWFISLFGLIILWLVIIFIREYRSIKQTQRMIERIEQDYYNECLKHLNKD